MASEDLGQSSALTNQLQTTEGREQSLLEKEILSLLKNKKRNMEKRKEKLDSYKQRLDAGEDLDKPQTDAVNCLSKVQNNLKFVADLQKDLIEMFPEWERIHQAALAAEQHDRDISKVCQLLELQKIMENLHEYGTIDYFEVASEESMDQLREFDNFMTPKRSDEEEPLQALQKEPLQEKLLSASEHIVNFLEGSTEPVMDTTYKALNELLSSIKSRNYFCPSCLAVYDPEKVYDEEFEYDVNDQLLQSCDLGPLGAYGEGGIGDANITYSASCGECNETIELNVVVTATAVYDDYDHEYRMPSIDYFEDAEIKAVLSRDTSVTETTSLMDIFEFAPEDYDDDLPSIGEYDFTEDELNLLMIVKTRMNNGFCFIGWDMDNGELVRPILRTATNQCCWRKTDPVLDVGQQHRFQIYSRYLQEIPFPHKNNDVLVHYLERIDSGETNTFGLLASHSFNRVKDVFSGANIKERRYVIEGDKCSSVGIYKCSGNNLTVFDIKYSDGNIKKRCKIIDGEITFLFPITALQPYFPTHKNVLVIMGLARPFPGYNNEYNPKHCAILVLGIIPEPN